MTGSIFLSKKKGKKKVNETVRIGTVQKVVAKPKEIRGEVIVAHKRSSGSVSGKSVYEALESK